MRRARFLTASLALVAGLIMVCAQPRVLANGPVTYYKDVLPIMQARCQDCHRPGEIAPMSLLTYAETRHGLPRSARRF